MDSTLSVPVITPEMSTLDAALAYAAAGFYVGPAKRATKNPGSIIGDPLTGKGWQRHTSRDPQVIAAWFAGSDHGVFLHAGRSGCVIFDVDNPDKLHPAIREATTQCRPPYQSTRVDQPGRGHYLFTQPAGRTVGNSLGGLASGWGEVRGLNGVIIAAPSEHKDGGVYQWHQTGPVPALPGYLATQLPDALEAAETATDDQVAAFLAEHARTTRPELLDIHAAAYRRKIAAGDSRHDTMTGHLAGAMKEAAAGLLDAKEAAETLQALFLAAVAQPATSTKQGEPRTGAVARNEWRGLLAWAVAQGRTADPEATRARVAEKVPPQASELPTEDRLAALGALLAELRTWQHLPDPVHIIVTLAAAATRNSEGEPCWVLMVAPPSSGKTEAARLLDGTADARLNEVTAAGLLGWSKGKQVRPSGVLTRIGDRGLVTFGDLSSLLATSDRGGRDQVFGLLRRAYDGHVTRDISPPGKVESDERLQWSGRLTVVACVTGAIDRYSAHADQLGPRWVYVRIADRSTVGKRAAAQLARRGDLAAHRASAKESAANLLASLPDDLPDLPDEVADEIEDAALVTAWGRGSVPRNGYGRREIEDVPVIEEPMRLVQQLGALARGVLALGMSNQAAAGIARRVALDSMPASRRAVLEALSTGEVLSTAGCARAAGLHRHVARMTLEELAAIGVVEHDRTDEEGEDPLGVVNWSLSGEDGAVVADVFQAHRDSNGGWHETLVYTSTSPQEREVESAFTKGEPTLRATPAAAPSDPPEPDDDRTPTNISGTDWLTGPRMSSGAEPEVPCESRMNCGNTVVGAVWCPECLAAGLAYTATLDGEPAA